MARPALSATRAIDILNLFAAVPGRSFTMSEIIRATGVNIASCHALLAALTESGFLERRGRHYLLGRAAIVVGEAAAASQPLVRRARAAAEALNGELGLPVLLSTLAGDELLALASLPDPGGHHASLRTGQRVPLIPPVGVHFLAWASEAAIAAWLSRAGDASENEIASWKAALALTHERGFQVTLRSETRTGFADLMRSMATGSPPVSYRVEASHLIVDHGWTFRQPATIEPEARYDVGLIAAPIFDRDGHAMLSLGCGPFAAPLAGARIEALAARLMEECLRVMKEQRAA